MSIELTVMEHSLHIIRFLGFLSTILWGILLIKKGRKSNNRLPIEMGIVIVTFPGGLTNETVFYIYWLITGNYIPLRNWVPIGLAIIAIAVFLWLDICTSTIYPLKKKLRKIVLITFLIYVLILWILINYILFFTSELIIRTMVHYEARPFDNKFTGIGLVYLISIILIGSIAWLLFGIKAIQSKTKREIIIKGKFILTSFLIFTSGLVLIILDGPVYSLPYILNRIIFIILFFGLFLFYCGFSMPKFIKKLFDIEDEIS